MASFLGILKNVFHGVEKAAPFISTGLSMVNPAAGAIFNTVMSSVNKAETLFQAPKQGETKAAFVISEFESGLAIANDIFALRGETLVYDKVALQEVINGQVAVLNAIAKLKASFSTTKGSALPPVTVTENIRIANNDH